MIARLSGRIAAIEADAVVVDVGGVGYRVVVPASTLSGLGRAGDEVALHTRLQVRDDALVLFGTVDGPSIGLFDRLITVSGVGPRLALALLSTLDAQALASAIAAEDVGALVAAPGVGKKIAQRIVLELRPHLADAVLAGTAPLAAGFGSADELDAVAALTGLGYTPAEARRALAASDLPAEADVGARVMAALRVLGRG
jgi:Holliday junction DNA helicase RuvA